MKLATLACGANGTPGAVLASSELLDLRRATRPDSLEEWLPSSVRGILNAGPSGLDLVRAIVSRVENSGEQEQRLLRSRGVILPSHTPLLAPVPDPRLIVAAGLAYRSHLAEMAGTPQPPHPTGFMKSPNSVIGSDTSVRLPAQAPDNVDYEGEVAVIFGRTCHAVSASEALDYVAGYTVANDFSARDWVRQVWDATAPWDARRTWEVNIMGKQFPGFTALGPVLATSDSIGTPAETILTTRINGTVVQEAPMSDMIFGIAETIAHFARWYLFQPGDILLTGTPAGVGAGRDPQLFLRDGDLVEVDVCGIGTLRNKIIG